jgi:hypothetical protein
VLSAVATLIRVALLLEHILLDSASGSQGSQRTKHVTPAQGISNTSELSVASSVPPWQQNISAQRVLVCLPCIAFFEQKQASH